jgi:hypothetical protein
MLAVVQSSAGFGVHECLVQIQADIANGLSALNIVALPRRGCVR